MPHSKSRNENWKREAPKRRAKAVSKANKEFEDDTAHAMSKPINPTPLQLQRLEKSLKKLAQMQQRKESNRGKRFAYSQEELNKMPPSKFLELKDKKQSDA